MRCTPGETAVAAGGVRARHALRPREELHLKRSISHALFAATLAGATALSSAAFAETVLKWAHVYEVSESYHTCAVDASDKLKAATEGRYSIEVFPASSLGKEVDINEGLGLGTVDIIYTGQLFAGRAYGPIAIGGAPYMFRDYDHWDKYRSSELFAELSKGYGDATGNHISSLTYYGKRHATSNVDIQKPEDMAGLKIRVPNAPLYMMFPIAVGANPTPIAFAEVYLALQQGTVDAQENPLPTIQAKKFYEVQKYITLTGHITDALLTIVGGPAWNAMDATDQKALEGVLDETATCATDLHHVAPHTSLPVNRACDTFAHMTGTLTYCRIIGQCLH